MYAGFTEEELTLILKYALEHGMNINKRTSMYGDTYMHALIECDDYHGNLAPFLYLGYINGFNPDIKNFENKTVWDALKKPDTTKKIDESDRRLCFQIKKIYEIENKKDELLNLQKRITLLQEKEKSLKNFIDDNKGTNEEIIKALEKTL